MSSSLETSPSVSPASADPLEATPADPMDAPLDSSLAALDDEPSDVDLLLHDLDKPRRTRRSVRSGRQLHRGGEGRPVLVVDASSIARKFLALRLQGLGYDAHAAESGERALALIREYAFTLVFVELAVGTASRVDGLALCQDVKQECARTGMPAPKFVVTTGQTGSAHRVRGSLAGCDAFLNKPLVEGEFLETLRMVDPLFY